MPGIAWQAVFLFLIATVATQKLKICKGKSCSSGNSLTRRLLAGEGPHKKSNISQHEYVFKVKHLFESNWRNRVKNNGGRRKFTEDLSKNQLLVLKPKRSRRASDSYYLKNTHHFTYFSNVSSVGLPAVQPKKDRTADSAELRFILEPKKCYSKTQLVTITVLGKDYSLEVDPCQPRWNSINLPAHALQQGRRTILHTTCQDCIEKGVAYKKLNINVMLTENNKRPQSRRQKAGYCKREPLTIRFRDTPNFKNVIAPGTVDIGRCDGFCGLNHATPRQYQYLYNALSLVNTNLKRKAAQCCVPYDYKNLEYLIENGSKLVNSEWEDAIAVNCNCE